MKTLLIVDDEVELRDVMTRVLTMQGHRVTAAAEAPRPRRRWESPGNGWRTAPTSEQSESSDGVRRDATSRPQTHSTCGVS